MKTFFAGVIVGVLLFVACIMVSLYLSGKWLVVEDAMSHSHDVDLAYMAQLRELETRKGIIRNYLGNLPDVDTVLVSVPFIESAPDGTELPAAVVLYLRDSAALSHDSAMFIKRVVAGGFDGLSERNVTLTDHRMNPIE